ncbi:hypothetical protein FRZ06_18055 [Anoxybacterium hadale]|uniref:Uncharacterized protein n=1 Tax=Anoxybacterium hadale TaxID=3408580 RepID=A0ACD1AF54_9FIRM|nr:hypothetical protein FRZ06_18055 [Clostridiales bacterium]
MQYNDLIKMKEYAVALSKGIDPTSGLPLPEDTILNSKQLNKYFNQISEFLDTTIKSGENIGLKRRNGIYDFRLVEDNKKNIEISATPVSISEFTYNINTSINTEYMRKIKVTQITNWLLENGYLKIITDDDDNDYKIVTDKGQSVGIMSIQKCSEYGRKYPVNLYDSNAQKFIIENINSMV